MFTLAGALSFLRSPFAKILGGTLVVGLAIWFAVHAFNNWKHDIYEQGRLQGRKEVTMEFQAIVDENNKVNRRVEQKVDDALDRFTSKLMVTLDHVRGESANIAKGIVTQIEKQPIIYKNANCTTPPEMINARNAIRHLGPTTSGETAVQNKE